jgi:ribonuclease Y
MITLIDVTNDLSIVEIICFVALLIVGVALGILIIKLIPAFKGKNANKKAQTIIKEAETKAERIVKNAQLDGKQAAYEAKQEAEKEIKERKAEYAQQENKLNIRESNIDRRDAQLTQKEDTLDKKNELAAQKLKDIDQKNALLQAKIDSIIVQLEKVSGLSTKEAHDELFRKVESKMSGEIAAYIKNEEDKAKDEVEDKARDLLGLAVTKYAQDVTSERTVSVVALPSDEMKGRIIGREGRNIRSLEQLLGVDLIIDDTPEVITVSCFDPVRREVARRALEYLIRDGRIQPGRIEEMVAKSQKEVDESVAKAGEEAAFKLGLPKINKELLTFVGRLKYRTSYGQNCYDHSIEVATLAGVMAAELGLDQNMAKRAGLLHDIGKAADSEMDGSHVEIGVRLAKKYGEPDIVINSIESHHGDVEAKYVISQLVAAADALSAARPGARSEILENYIKRIEALETLCKSYDGVAQAYAMQSGREVRVMVVPDKIDDLAAFKLAHDIRERIENEMTYPGQIKVSVIREYRATDLAK